GDRGKHRALRRRREAETRGGAFEAADVAIRARVGEVQADMDGWWDEAYLIPVAVAPPPPRAKNGRYAASSRRSARRPVSIGARAGLRRDGHRLSRSRSPPRSERRGEGA